MTVEPGDIHMAYEMTIRLNDQEYALLAAEAAKSGKPPEMLLHELIQHLRSTPQQSDYTAKEKF